MNRNEVLEAMAKAANSNFGTAPPIAWEDLGFNRKQDRLEEAEAALTALEAIMERDGLKQLDENNGSEETVSDAPEWLVWKQAFSEAKCKLKGGDDVG